MKKVLQAMSGFVFGAFAIGVFALLMSLTYQALQKLFPNSFENQIWGMIVYDVAALCWALAFVFKSKSIVQYAAAGTGFIAALIGTLGMVAAEVMLGGQTLVPTQTQQIGQWMVYGFIGVTILHVLMIYTHHGAAPEIWEEIDIGIARSQVTDAAMKQATNQIAKETNLLADCLAQEIVDRVKRDLRLPIPIKDTVFDRRRNEADTVPLPVIETETQALNRERAKQELAPLAVPANDPPYIQQPKDEPISAQPPFPAPLE